MQLARFSFTVDYLRDDHEIRENSSNIRIYRYFDNQWFDEKKDCVVGTDALIARLEKTRGGAAWRLGSHCDVYFPSTDLDLVVVVTFATPPRKKTQDRFGLILRRALQRARDAFDADHDPLTGLLNRRGLEARLKSLRLAHPPIPDNDATSLETTALVLAALDLDFFKQVNDSFGHDYGDIVLQAFALRLENAVSRLGQDFGNGYSFTLSRTGGEEFLLLGSGPFSKDQLIQLGDELCESVRLRPVPDDLEWSLLRSVRPSTVSLPTTKERSLTVSIGMSTPSPAHAADIDKMKREADIALYRAKGSGRDQCCYFRDILARYGRVIQYHSSANVVAIDIGRLVGVKAGQEFHVFHPDFVGGVVFQVADGRTKKKVGFYPQYSHARIVVFHVQDEISFCQVAENRSNEPIQSGCVLEPIPAGTFSHLLDTTFELTGTSGLTKPEDVASLAEQLARENLLDAVAVFALQNFDEVVERRGSVLANDILAKLFDATRRLGGGQATAQISSFELAVVLKDVSDPFAWASKLMASVMEETNRLGRIGAGLFVPKHKDSSVAVIPTHSIEYARYAAALSNVEKNPACVVFDGSSAYRILQGSRSRKDHTKAIADWKRLRELGVNHPLFHNAAGLCFLEMTPTDPQDAISAFTLALHANPEDPTIASNKGYAEYSVGGPSAAADSFLAATKMKNFKKFHDVYVPRAARSLYHAALQGKLVDRQPALAALDSYREILKQQDEDVSEIDEMIAILRNGGGNSDT